MRMTAELNSTLQVADEVEDLRLHGDVEGRRRLVGDEQVRVAREGYRDHGSLAHAAGELVGVVVDAAARLRDADAVEHLDGVLLRDGVADVVVHSVGLHDLAADRVEGMHRRERVLEDHRHPLAAQPAHLLGGRADELLPTEPDGASHANRARLVQAHDGHARDRLARAGLSDDAERLAAREVEGDAVDGLDEAVVGREVHAQVAHRQERVRCRGAEATDAVEGVHRGGALAAAATCAVGGLGRVGLGRDSCLGGGLAGLAHAVRTLGSTTA